MRINRRVFLKLSALAGLIIVNPSWLKYTMAQETFSTAQASWLMVDSQKERLWTPRFTDAITMNEQRADLVGTSTIGFASGQPLKARLLGFRGLQNIRSHRYVLLELSNGQTRGYPVSSFSDEDQRFLQSISIEFSPQPRENLSRTVVYDPQIKTDPFDLYESPHFAFFVGKRLEGDSAVLQQPEFLDAVKEYFEVIWTFFEMTLRYPMPFSDDARQPFGIETPLYAKINVYLTQTGLSLHLDEWAVAAQDIAMNPLALQEGSSTVPHEFTHVVQFYSNGFQNNSSVGYFWETHAEWCSHQFIPAYVPDWGLYLNQMYQPPNWAGFRYGSWILLQHLAEIAEFGIDFVRDLWLHVQRDPETNTSIEDPIQVILRLGQDRGLLSGDPVQTFGDQMGALAARLVVFDFVFQQTYLHQAELQRGENWLTSAGTKVIVSPEDGWYRPIPEEQPGQWGINHIALQPTRSNVEIKLRGLTQDATWRAVLVAYKLDGQVRYSEMLRDGQLSMPIEEDERVKLAVVAVPNQHEPLPFELEAANIHRYPYEFKMSGAEIVG